MPEQISSVTLPSSEYEALKDRLYNLSLYLNYIEDFHPIVFRKLNRLFDGMPGYTGKEDASETVF